jgi:hypothetical protein
MRWDGSLDSAHGVVAWVRSHDGRAHYSTERLIDRDGTEDTTPRLCIVTLEGTMLARVDDWVIRGVAGEFYPCRADIFAETYQEAAAPSEGHEEWEPTPGRPGWEAAPQPRAPAYLCSSSPEPPCDAEVTHLLRPVGKTWDGAATCADHYPHADG